MVCLLLFYYDGAWEINNIIIIIRFLYKQHRGWMDDFLFLSFSFLFRPPSEKVVWKWKTQRNRNEGLLRYMVPIRNVQ